MVNQLPAGNYPKSAFRSYLRVIAATPRVRLNHPRGGVVIRDLRGFPICMNDLFTRRWGIQKATITFRVTYRRHVVPVITRISVTDISGRSIILFFMYDLK